MSLRLIPLTARPYGNWPFLAAAHHGLYQCDTLNIARFVCKVVCNPTYPSGVGAPHDPPGALALSASLIAAISHGSRPPYPQIDSIAVPTAPWRAYLYLGCLGYRPACSCACTQLFAAPAQADLGASRAGPAIPKTRDCRTPGNEGRYQAPQCRLPVPKRTLYGYIAYYRF